MVRALVSACILLGVCLGGSAWAKPKIAVLGLEAAPGPSGAVDPSTTQIARAITKELRHRAQAVASPFTVAPNSNKELTDEKLLMSCDSEAPSCMVVIGAGLAADVLVYGRVEKKGELYRVSLKRLDVSAKTVVSAGEELPVGSSVVGLSKRLYVKLVGEPAVTGTLIVRAASQTGALVGAGNVMVDDELRGELASGRVTLSGLAEGRHVLAIEASGYRRFEETVTVRSGEPATLNAVLLVRAPRDGSDTADHTGLWKVTLGTSIAVAVAGGLFAGYSNYEMAIQDVRYRTPVGVTVPPTPIGSDQCGLSPEQIRIANNAEVENFAVFQTACRWHGRIYYGLAIAGVGAVGAVVSVVMLSRGGGTEETPRTGARSKKSEVALTPVVTPSLTGASLSVSW